MTTFMRIAAFMLVSMIGGSACAQVRPDTWRMSCAASAELVRRTGAIVLHSGPDIYDRYVIAQNFCYKDEVMKPRWVPAADNPQCFIGYACVRESWGAGPN